VQPLLLQVEGGEELLIDDFIAPSQVESQMELNSCAEAVAVVLHGSISGKKERGM
jgi:hypothetical protein